ncbi:hypothetical protein ACNQFZ_06740 [Schinkia sp. CFF1]
MKKIIMALLLVFSLSPIYASAAYVTQVEYYEPNDTYDITIELNGDYLPAQYYKIWVDGIFVYSSENLNPLSAESYSTNCNGEFVFKFYDINGNIVGSEDGQKFTLTEIKQPSVNCGAGNDTGGTEEPPPDDGGGTTDPPPSGGIECPGCEMFECPGWDEYMGKINDIIDGFPSITEAIADQTDTIKNEIVGQPPSLPSAPSDPAPVDTYDFENSAPEMIENPDLGDSGFTSTDIENDAPEIQFNDDPTGGFDIKDPVEALPDPPTEYPIPGETDAGEWEHNPTDEVEKPQPPIVELHPFTPYPLPSDEGTAPPSPGDGGGSAPVPSTTTEIDGSYNYKTHPDNLDGI